MNLHNLFEDDSRTPNPNYAEELAYQIFKAAPNLDTTGAADEVLDYAFDLAVNDLGRKRAHSLFSYDEDFDSDLVNAYLDLQMNQQAVDKKQVNEVDPRNFDSDEDYYTAKNAPAKRRGAPSDYPYSPEEDDAYFREIFRKKREAAKKAEQDKDQGVAEGQETDVGVVVSKLRKFVANAEQQLQNADYDQQRQYATTVRDRALKALNMIKQGGNTPEAARAAFAYMQSGEQGVAEGVEDKFSVADKVEQLVNQYRLYDKRGWTDLFAKLAGRKLAGAEIYREMEYASKFLQLLDSIRMRSDYRGQQDPRKDQELIDLSNQWLDLFNKATTEFKGMSGQGVAEDLSRRGFLKGVGAAAVGAAGLGAMSNAQADQQDLGNGFVLTTVDVAGHTVSAVLDTQSDTYYTMNRRPNGNGAILRSMAPFIIVKNGQIKTSMDVGQQTMIAMKKAKLMQEGVAEELAMQHQRDHKTQKYADTSNSLAKRSISQAEVPNVSKSADGHPTVRGRADSTRKTYATRVDPTITPTSVKRLGGDRPIPSFLQKNVAEANKKKDDDLGQEIKDVSLNRAITRAKADFPTAGSGIEALAKDFMRSQEQDQTAFGQLRQAERKQDQMLSQISKIDQEQEKEIQSLDNQNSSLASRLQQLQNVNSELEKKLAAMSGRKKEKRKDKSATAPEPSLSTAPATPATGSTTEPDNITPEPSASPVIGRMAQDLTAEPSKSKAIGQIARTLSPPSAAIDQMAQQLKPRQKELDFDNGPGTLKPKKFDTSRATDVVARDPREIAKDVKQNIQQYGSDLAGSRSDALRNLVAQDELPMENDDKEAKYGDKYQDMVARVGQKAREQEKSKPVDIKDLARRLAAIEASRKD